MHLVGHPCRFEETKPHSRDTQDMIDMDFKRYGDMALNEQ